MPPQCSRRAPTRPGGRAAGRVLLAVLLLLTTVAAAACSSGSGDDRASTSTSKPLAPEFADPASTTTSTEATTTTTSPFAVPSADANVEGLTQELLATSAAGVSLSAPQARCVASGMLTKLGLDNLARLGSQPGASNGALDLGGLTPAEREAFADALIGCIDLNELMVEQLGPSLGLPPSAVGCVAQHLAADGTLTNVLRQAVVSGADPAGSDAALTAPMLAALDSCLTPEQLRNLTVPR